MKSDISHTPLPSSPRQGVTARALLIAFALAPLNTFFLVKCLYTDGGFSSGSSLFYNSIAALFLLAIVNPWLKRRRPGWGFSAGELLTIYSILAVNTGLVGITWSFGGALAPVISYPFGFAALGNQWQERLWPYLPAWLTVRDSIALRGFLSGDSTPYAWAVIRWWVGPAFWWATFIGALMWVCFCLGSLMRRRWSDEEKLSFPLTIVPLEMADERSGLMQHRGWRLAFAGSFGLVLWNRLATATPSLPRIPLSFDFTPFVLHRPPWAELGYPTIGWEPWFIGLCYIMPLDLIFSLGVFNILSQAAVVIGTYFGAGSGVMDNFLHTQRTGAALALALALLWLDRRYLREVLKRVIGLNSSLQETERQEAFTYRTAVIGLLLGLAYLYWFWARAGVPGWVVAAFFGLYLLIMLTMSRIRAQMGPPTFDLKMPDTVLGQAFGSIALGPQTQGMFYLLFPFLYWQDNHPAMPQLESLKLVENGRMNRRRIAMAITLVVPLTVFAYFWGHIHFGYTLGLASGKGSASQLQAAGLLTSALDVSLRQPTSTDQRSVFALGIGAGLALALLFLKLQFPWWPLHPIALPISYCWMMSYQTPILFVTWAFKLLLLRYGGLHAHRAALPYFQGMLVGGFTASFFIMLVFPAPAVRQW